MRSLLCKRFRLLPYDVHPVHFAFHLNNTSHQPSCIRTYDFYQIHFSLHFQSVSERIPIPIPITIPYRATPQKICLILVPWCVCTMYIRTTETNGERYMYIKHVLSDNTLLNSPRDLSCWKRNFPPGIQKDFFGGVFELVASSDFLGYVRFVCIY